jgi:quinol monooxygenase YgiN
MTVMAVFDFDGDSDALIDCYDRVLAQVVAVSSGRPVVHLAVPREYGLMVCDVWDSEAALDAFVANEDFHRVMAEGGLPEPRLRRYPVHNLGWPVAEMPLYR